MRSSPVFFSASGINCGLETEKAREIIKAGVSEMYNTKYTTSDTGAISKLSAMSSQQRSEGSMEITWEKIYWKLS